MRLRPHIDKELEHFLNQERRKSAQREFVRLRKHFCDFMTALNAEVLVPHCVDCCSYQCNTFEIDLKPPDILADTWQSDLAWEIGLTEEEIKNIEEKIGIGEDLEVRCHQCRQAIQYGQDDCYVDKISFSEYFDIPERDIKRPPKRLRKELGNLYEKKCFGCSLVLTKKDISCDHIVAHVHEGKTSVLNLQILCVRCNTKIKGELKAKEINVHLTFPFRPPPSDAYEGAIW
ncbi:MAG: HNH endonuclease [Candidatus Omnitrophica bacterium]|nr:HNH endonuclease [Candidatus Omnitrophota bacterium]